MSKTRRTLVTFILAAAVGLGLAWSPPAHAATSPNSGTFTDQFNGTSLNLQAWCPTYNARYGCNTIQSGHYFVNVFDPRQLTVGGGQAVMTLVKHLYGVSRSQLSSGAFNGYGKQAYREGSFTARIHLDCSTPGVVSNWPGFWLFGTQGAYSEIDIAEGLGGHVKWHYWYVDKNGIRRNVGGLPKTGNYCGWHTYEVYRGIDSLTFYYDGVNVGHVTAQEIGVPINPTPMYPRFDYGTCAQTWCGPIVTAPRQNKMRVDYFTYKEAVSES